MLPAVVGSGDLVPGLDGLIPEGAEAGVAVAQLVEALFVAADDARGPLH
jgi:hypothetical protein